MPGKAVASASPSISTQPQNESVIAGLNATFTVLASGQGTLDYQWSLNGTNLTDSAHISGATNATLTISDVGASDAGNYQVVVSNSHGSVTSSNATLTVLVPAGIGTQPTGQSILLGNNVTFTIAAKGDAPLAYQWYFNGAPLADGGRITGSMTASLTISDVQLTDAGGYFVTVTNDYGTATSIPAALTTIPVTHYVSVNSTNPKPPFTDWSTAAANIQDAVDAATPGDLILVTNGVYQTGGRVVYGTMTNRVVINKAVTVRSVNGPAATVIQGNPSKDDNAVRCAYLATNAALIGFTLTNGSTRAAGDINNEQSGGGVWCESTTATISNCVFAANWANYIGGGVYSGTCNQCTLSNSLAIQGGGGAASSVLVDCMIISNSETIIAYGGGGALNSTLTNCNLIGNASPYSGGGAESSVLYTCTLLGNTTGYYGAGAHDSTLSGCILNKNAAGTNGGGADSSSLTNCLLADNSAGYVGGGVENCTLTSCTVVGNTAASHCGGVIQSTMFNCIIYYNHASDYGDNFSGGYFDNTWDHCCTTPIPYNGASVITNEPDFVNSNNFRLNPGSPCINAGNNAYVSSTTDLDGNARVVNSVVDIGAYEFQAWPFLISSPSNQSAAFGQMISFHVVVAGNQPLIYHWYFNGLPLADGGRIAGSTTTNLTIANVQLSDAGKYFAVITNSFGAVTSDVATLTVGWPSIISQPASQIVLEGSPANFSAAVSGPTPLSYQWYFNGLPLTDSGRVSGSATTNLNIANVQSNDFGSYQLVVTNNYGSATSSVATLTVVYPANIAGQPASQAVLLNSNATFTAAVAGTGPLSLHWIFNSEPLTDGGRITGSTTTNLNIANAQTNDAGAYQLVVTNNYGLATSAIATLTVHVPAIITGQPASQSVLLTSNVTFSAAVAGDAPLSFQWYFNNTPLADGERVSGSATTNLSIANVQTNDIGVYQLVVTNNYGSATSAPAALTVWIPAEVTLEPVSQLVLVNSNASFSTSAIGTAPLSYQWYSNGVALANGGRISGVTSPTLTISGAQTNDSAAYQVVVTNSYGAVTSQVATLTVLAPVQITGQPESEAVLLGSNATFSVAATGSGTLNYRWYFNGTPLADNGHISGSATPTLSVLNIQSGDAGGYVVLVSNLLSSATSLTASLTPQASPGSSVRYVALTSTNPTPPYLDWSTAATNIQDAVDAAVAGDLVLVSNGTYDVGGRVEYGTTPNRVVVNKAITVQSVNGPAATTIMGIYNPAIAYPTGRCVYLTNNASLSGFTLTFGGTVASGDVILNQSGGGVWCESSSAVISNCVLTENHVPQYGGGAFGGTLIGCVLSNNSASYGGGTASNILLNCALADNFASYENVSYGGGASGCTLSNCLIVGNHIGSDVGYGGGAAFSTLTSCVVSNNSAYYGGGVCFGIADNSLISSNVASSYGGGAYSNILNNCVIVQNRALRIGGGGASGSTLFNCTIISNTASAVGGGIDSGTLNNCIVYHNYAPKIPDYPNDNRSVLNYCDTVSALATNGIGNITNEPLFVNLASGDFHLQSNSPCINSGNNSYVTVTNDFDGNPRIVGGTVDIGAYEFQSPSSILSYAWAQQYGLPTDGSDDYADPDGDGMNNYQEWIAGTNPTNALSVLQMLTPVVTNTTAGVVVTWQSALDRTYFIQRCGNLSKRPPFSTIQSNIVGQAGTTSYTDTSATNGGSYFYRVGVQ